MRQHAIPQNVLDVEFKLFTKFTLKEFAYLALGIGFGGLMIYLTVEKIVPPVIGIPVFILSSGIGIFLGLVPINDQDADKFIQSYITAINNPTQRAWMNKKMKAERVKPDVKPNEKGELVAGDSHDSSPKIIGGSVLNTSVEGVKEEEGIDKDVVEIPKSIQKNHLILSEENLKYYRFSINNIDSLPGNINLWLSSKELKAIPNVIAYLKTKDGKMLYANKTGPNGYFLTNRIWDQGVYIVEFEHPQYSFPVVEIVLSDVTNKLPIKISSL